MYPKTQQEADRRLAQALYSSSQQKYIFKKNRRELFAAAAEKRAKNFKQGGKGKKLKKKTNQK
jgi:hypothetical protein